jgi:hypothetical protein
MYLPIAKGSEKVETSALHYISIPAQVYTDLCAFVDHYDTEVSGCGMVERIEHRTKAEDKDEPDEVEIEFRIKEVYLPDKQDNSASSTDIDDDVIANLLSKLLGLGKNTEHLRLHWHSHADMATFHSGTDEDNYATLSNGDFLVSLVLNKAHNVLGRIDYFKPVRVTISDMAVYLVMDNEYKPSKEAVESIKALDTYVNDKPKYTYVKDTSYDGYGELGLIGKPYEAKPYTKDDKELDAKEKMMAQELRIKYKDAIRYKNCSKLECTSCDDVIECNEFLYHTDNYDIC